MAFGSSKFGISTMKHPGYNSLGAISAGLGIVSGVSNLFGDNQQQSPQQAQQMADPFASQRQQYQSPLQQMMFGGNYNPFLQALGSFINPQKTPYQIGLENFMTRQGLMQPQQQSQYPSQVNPTFDVSKVFAPQASPQTQQQQQQNTQVPSSIPGDLSLLANLDWNAMSSQQKAQAMRQVRESPANRGSVFIP